MVHRPYTQRGDIFINLHPDRLEVHNPGLLPAEGDDRVVVIVQKQIAKPEIIDFMAKVEQTFQPTQRELITLGLVAQQEAVTAIDIQQKLALKSADDLKRWLGKLREWGLVSSRGRTKGTEYFVDPKILRRLEFKGSTTLRGIQKHRLRELILQDLSIYREAAIGQIHERIGLEIARRKIQRTLAELVDTGKIRAEGERRARRYFFVPEMVEKGQIGTKIGSNRGAEHP